MHSNDKERMNLDEPLWDQSTFYGRLKYFFWVTDPRTVFKTDNELEEAKKLLTSYREGNEPKGTTKDEIIYARKLYESAYHPDTGELINVFGRMSFQVPGGMIITGAMLQFYKKVPAVLFWQWVNQSFNAFVAYTNFEHPLSTEKFAIAYLTSTATASGTALGLQSLLQRRAPPFFQRFVPFFAIAAANIATIPLMRQSELLQGILMFDDNGSAVTASRLAAFKGISEVVLSRILMSAPGMLMLPFIMQKLETYPVMKKITYLHAPIQVLFAGCFLVIMVPVACSLFPQKCSMEISTLERWEPKSYSSFAEKNLKPLPDKLYFKKGL